MTRERALRVAVDLADKEGIDGLTMRRLAEAMSIEAMSLYHHVKNKDDILDGMVNVVFTEITPTNERDDWRTAMQTRSRSVREVLLRHRWALRLIESRASPGRATLGHHDAVLGCLFHAGFSASLAGHAYATIDAFVYGFVHTELQLPFTTSEEAQSVAKNIFEHVPQGMFVHLMRFTKERVLRPGYAYSDEFEFGLTLILDAFEQARVRESKVSTEDDVTRGQRD